MIDKDLKKFIFNNNFSWLLYAKRRSGKSILLTVLLIFLMGQFDKIIFFSNTYDKVITYQILDQNHIDIINMKEQKKSLNELVGEVYDSIQKTNVGAKLKYLILFDDVIGENSNVFRDQKKNRIAEILNEGRNNGISLILLVQSLRVMPPTFIENFDLITFFRVYKNGMLTKIYDSIGFGRKRDFFDLVRNSFTHDYDCITLLDDTNEPKKLFKNFVHIEDILKRKIYNKDIGKCPKKKPDRTQIIHIIKYAPKTSYIHQLLTKEQQAFLIKTNWKEKSISLLNKRVIKEPSSLPKTYSMNQTKSAVNPTKYLPEMDTKTVIGGSFLVIGGAGYLLKSALALRS